MPTIDFGLRAARRRFGFTLELTIISETSEAFYFSTVQEKRRHVSAVQECLATIHALQRRLSGSAFGNSADFPWGDWQGWPEIVSKS